jgi:hypothetical protein
VLRVCIAVILVDKKEVSVHLMLTVQKAAKIL